MDQEEARTYHAYLLRLWCEGEGGDWRAMLEDPHTGERRGFPDIGALIAYLVAQTSADRPHQPPRRPATNNL